MGDRGSRSVSPAPKADTGRHDVDVAGVGEPVVHGQFVAEFLVDFRQLLCQFPPRLFLSKLGPLFRRPGIRMSMMSGLMPVALHIDRQDRADFMPQLFELATVAARRRAGFHGDYAFWVLRHEGHELSTRNLDVPQNLVLSAGICFTCHDWGGGGDGSDGVLADWDRLAAITAQDDPLETLAATVDFEMLRPVLEKALDRPARLKGGRRTFDPVLMFRMLVLQSLHGLSLEQTQYLAGDQPSWMRFCQIGPETRVPDVNTLWDFRGELIAASALTTCLSAWIKPSR